MTTCTQPAFGNRMRTAARIAKRHGIKSAAGYLRKRGFSIELALWVLCRTGVRSDPNAERI
jgi:hypothetical protein